MHFLVKISFITTVLLVGTNAAWAQTKLDIERAEFIESGQRNGQKFNKVIGDVIFSQQNVKIFCDSAYLYKKSNRIEAYGKVKIKQGDSVTITSRRLIYTGSDKVAKLRGNVVFNNKQVTLYTDFLDFDRKTQTAFYFNDGKLVDSTNQITSNKGYFNAITKVMSYKRDVLLVNPDFDLTSDTLVYNTRTKIVYFVAPTRVVDKQNNIFNYEDGQYDTSIKLSDLFTGTIETEDFILKGDKLRLNDQSGYYKATGNVVLISGLRSYFRYLSL